MNKLELSISKEADLPAIKNIGKAIESAIRLKIIQLVKDGEENINYGDLAEKVGKSPTAITNHMKWLGGSGIIDIKIVEGKRGKMQKIPSLMFDEIVIKLR